MSEGGALALGALIGFVVVLSVFIAKRDDIARNWRLVRGRESAEAMNGTVAPPRGIGVRAAVFCAVVGALTIAAGVLTGQVVILMAGIVLLAAVVIGRHLRTSSRDQ